ncbi:MAG: PAS domain S-box protein, partial [Ignavibacteria bacterium]
MKIKNQFIIIISVFSVILLVIAASVFTTEQQVTQLSAQEATAANIERSASSLNSISMDYFLYQEDYLQLPKWSAAINSLHDDLSGLKLDNRQHQMLANNIDRDLHGLNQTFNEVTAYLQNASRTVSVRIDPAFQQRWSNMALQSQALAFDSSQLSNSINSQAHQANDTNTLLIVSLACTFGAFLAIIYLMVFRRTLKSVGDLQKGIDTIGSGNLEYVIETDRKDEIGELSHSFNKMTCNLKTVTTSKINLEKAQAFLQESEERWATTLASIGDAVIATDLSGKITFMNGIAEGLTGWKLSEALQKPIKEVFNIVNEQTRLEVENPVHRVLKEGVVVGLANHTILIRKDHVETPIDDSGAPIKNKEQETTGVVLIFRDIAQRKKAEEATMQQAELINLSPDAIIVRKLNGTITFWSKGAEKLYGWTKDEAIGQDINLLLKTEFPQSLEEIQNILKMEGKWSGEIVHICKDGSKLVVQSYWLGKLGSDGKIFDVLESNVDVTERIQMQFKLEESAIRLEEYANQMESLANKRAEELKNSERLAAIGATAGMVGHDIRNPLQAITGDLFLAKTELAETPDSEEKKNT